MSQQQVILTTQGLTKEFQGFRAVDGVALSVTEGTLHALVGPNGAGKTTLFKLLTGFLAPTAGRIVVNGHDVTGRPPEWIAGRGVARSFQVTSLFAGVFAREHVESALQAGTGLGRRFWRSEKLMRRFSTRAEELLDEVGGDGAGRDGEGRLPDVVDEAHGGLSRPVGRSGARRGPAHARSGRPASTSCPTGCAPPPRRRRSARRRPACGGTATAPPRCT
ncbi:ABC-type glutathione transport system ATPase component [Streptomyces sp. TE5632]